MMYKLPTQLSLASISMPSLCLHIKESISTTSMSYLALSPPFATCMLPPVSPQNQHGSKPFDEATTALGPSST
jgi:hypothetical protein